MLCNQFDKIDKFSPKAEACVLVGYSTTQNSNI